MDTKLLFVICNIGVIFLAILYAMVSTYKKTAAAKHWPFTMGIVLTSAVEKRRYRRRDVNNAIVRYSYRVGERTYQNAKVSLGPAARGAEAKKVAARYPVGAQVMVYYNPKDPSEAVLEKKNSTQWTLWLMLIILVLMSYTMIQAMLQIQQP